MIRSRWILLLSLLPLGACVSPRPEEKPPEQESPAQQLDLAQLEQELQPGTSENSVGDGGLADQGSSLATADEPQRDQVFSVSDLDQKPRVIYQPGLLVDDALKKKAPATVHVVFVVDPSGNVESPLVQKSTDSAFERPALSAVKQWKFRPGQRQGVAVRFRMQVPITFPAES